MPDYSALLPLLEKELPAVLNPAEREAAAASVPARAPLNPDVVGQGTSSASPSSLPTQDADVLSQQSGQGPNQALLSDQSNPDIVNRWKQYLAGGAGIAGAGGAGLYLANQGAGGNVNSQIPPTTQKVSLPGATVTVDSGDDDEDESTPAKSAAGAATPSSDEASDQISSTAASPYTPSPNIASTQKLMDLYNQANEANKWQRFAQAFSAGGAVMGGRSSDPFAKGYEENIAANNAVPAQYQQAVQFQQQDPNSGISQTYRQMADQLGIPVHDQTSAAELMKAFPQIVNIKTREDMVQARKDIAQDRLMQMQSNNQMRQMMFENQINNKQNQTYDNTVKLLEQLRGSPAVSQAEKDIYSADKAKEIQNLAPGGDLNKLNPQLVSTLVSEIGKIANNGVSSQEELRALTPTTLRSQFAGVWQQLANNPTPANAGAFLKQYMQYTDGIKKQAQKVISDRYGRVINTVGSHLSPDQLGLLQENYINRFTDPMPGQPGYKAPQQSASQAPAAAPATPAAPQSAAPASSGNSPSGNQPSGNQPSGNPLIDAANAEAARRAAAKQGQ